jgi:hypothetical protein
VLNFPLPGGEDVRRTGEGKIADSKNKPYSVIFLNKPTTNAALICSSQYLDLFIKTNCRSIIFLT